MPFTPQAAQWCDLVETVVVRAAHLGELGDGTVFANGLNWESERAGSGRRENAARHTRTHTRTHAHAHTTGQCADTLVHRAVGGGWGVPMWGGVFLSCRKQRSSHINNIYCGPTQRLRQRHHHQAKLVNRAYSTHHLDLNCWGPGLAHRTSTGVITTN